MWAAGHLHQHQDQIQRVLQNTNVQQIHQVFTTAESQIADVQRQESSGMRGKLSWEDSSWRSCTLLHRDIYGHFTAKVYVFSDSVLCLGGKCLQFSESARVWEQDRISNFISFPEDREFDNLDGEPFVLEWKTVSQGTLQRSSSKRSKN